MKKSLIFFVLLGSLFVNLFGENIETENKFLLDQIQEIELKKKSIIDSFENGRETRNEFITEAANKLLKKRIEINNTPYRTAELQSDGSPSEFAEQGRKEAFDEFSNKIVNDCKLKIENYLHIDFMLDDLNYYYKKLQPKTISTEGDELIVTYDKYNGTDIGWNVNITVKTGDVEEFKTTSFLSYRKLTGLYPAEFGDEGFDEFCDKVDYYEAVFHNGTSPLVFELTYSANHGYSNEPSSYNIKFSDLKFYDSNSDNKIKKELDLKDNYIKKQMEPVYDVSEISSFYYNLSGIIISKMEDFLIKEVGLYKAPEILPKGTDGTYGPDGTYVLFGFWPSSKKAEDVNIDKSKKINVRGLNFYKGDDDFYYVEIERDSYYYENQYNYFKMEPIKWRILSDDYNGGCLLLAENILYGSDFIDYENYYENGEMRSWLNNIFYRNAFIDDDRNKIITTEVDNSLDSAIDSDNLIEKQSEYYGNNTNDKIFLLSENEVTSKKYGFGKYNANDKSRCRKATDFAMYNSASNYMDEEFGNNGSWWLRSSYDNRKEYNRVITSKGSADDYNSMSYNSGIGIVPALVVSYDDLLVENVENLKYSVSGDKIIFSWKNPDNSSFQKCIISMEGFKDIEVKGEKGAEVKKIIGGLETGKTYNFTIKTIDKGGNSNKGISIKSLQEDVPPAEVSDLKIIPSNKSLNIFLTTPDDLDSEKIIVSVSGVRDFVLQCNPGEEKILKVTSLENEKEYTIKVKTIDKAGNVGKEIIKKGCPDIETNIPILLPKGTDGTIGTKGTYVLFGDWPQSLKKASVAIDSSKSKIINGWTCYLGSDNNYYTKVKTTPYEDRYNYSHYYSDGSEIESGKIKYFKMEPLKWRVLSDDFQNGKLLVAENIISNSSFYKDINDRTINGHTICSDNYKYSIVRAYLNSLNCSDYDAGDFSNGGILNKSFTPEAASCINSVIVSNYGSNNLEHTMDKMFLLNYSDAVNKLYGFNDNSSRIRKPVDYALATGVYSSTIYRTKIEQSCWWLRSPSSDGYTFNINKVDGDGSMKYDRYCHDESFGVVPALSISSKYFISSGDSVSVFPIPEVSDLVATPFDKKITFSWTNPSINNFEKVIISIDGFKDIEVTGEKGAEILKTVGGLESGKEYNFTIKIADKNGNISNGIKIKSIINDSAPGEVIEPVAILGKNKIKIEWTNPSDLDFEKVLISGIIPTDIVIKSERLEKKNFKIKNIKNTDSLITLKTVDKTGNVSEGITIEPSSLAFTKDVILLPAGTDGSVGTKGRYVLFGDWPQTIKADDVTIETDETEYINGWDCYYGSDDCYYVKVITKPYNDDYYYYFSNGEKILDDKEVYFKLEPIKWRIVTDNYQGGKLLLAENIILSNCYNRIIDKRSINGETVYANNYKYSTIRAYLNGLDGSDYDAGNFDGKGFINFAFSPESIDKINTIKIDNSYESTTDNDDNVRKSQYYCEDTYDKIFLLSEDEITNSNYGFGYYKNYDTARQRQTTDYAKATGAYSVTSSNYKNNGWWGLRSPDDEYNNYGRSIGSNGKAFNYYSVNLSRCGVVPALSISF